MIYPLVPPAGASLDFRLPQEGSKRHLNRAYAEYLFPYIDEPALDFNVRKDSEGIRFEKALRPVVGKRLIIPS
jgi:hypothetical protein